MTTVTPYGVKGHQECDVDQGEIYNAESSGKTTDLAACKKSCEDEDKCMSITYHYTNDGTNVCSHYSTYCEKTKPVFDAITIRLKDHLNNNEECDVSKGEKGLPNSSGKVSSLAACQESCKAESACQSITLFADGQCQHFSTKCENRKSRDGAIAMRLKDHAANGKECDTSQGEVYMHESSEVTSSYDACMKSCQGVPACNGITFFARGWCSHFSTGCDNTKSTKDAHARKISPRPCAHTHATMQFIYLTHLQIMHRKMTLLKLLTSAYTFSSDTHTPMRTHHANPRADLDPHPV